MAFLRETAIRERAKRRAQSERVNVGEALQHIARKRAPHYDIFLSQTIRDAEIVLGVYDFLTEMNFVVFCDWIAAPETSNRAQVTPTNAELIRYTLSISDTLLFLDTEHSDQSLWMCWELGWFDGAKGPVGVLPVLADRDSYYRGREFLGLYPYLEIDDEGRLIVVRPVVATDSGFMFFEAPNKRSFDAWRKGTDDFMRPRIFDPWKTW